MIFDPQDSLARARNIPIARRETGFSENLDAAWEQSLATELTISPNIMLNRAMTERQEALERLLGEPFDRLVAQEAPNVPLFDVKIGPDGTVDTLALIQGAATEDDGGDAARVARREEVIDRLRARIHPDHQAEVLTLEELRQRADELAIEANRSAEAVQADANLAGIAGRFVGATGAAMVDPPNLVALLAGAPGRATILGKLALESLFAAGTESANQVQVQANRARLGLDAGFEQGAANVATATVGAGIFTAVGQMLAFAARRGIAALQKRLGRDLTQEERAAVEAEMRQQELLAGIQTDDPLAVPDIARNLDEAAAAVADGRTPDLPDLPPQTAAPARPAPVQAAARLSAAPDRIRSRFAEPGEIEIGDIGVLEEARLQADLGAGAEGLAGRRVVIGDLTPEAKADAFDTLLNPDGIVRVGDNLEYWRQTPEGMVNVQQRIEDGRLLVTGVTRFDEPIDAADITQTADPIAETDDLIDQFDDLGARRGDLSDAEARRFQETVDELDRRGYRVDDDGKVVPIEVQEGLSAALKDVRSPSRLPRIPQFPILDRIRKAGGVHPDSRLGQELRAMGMVEKMSAPGGHKMPGLFRRTARRTTGTANGISTVPLVNDTDTAAELFLDDPDFAGLPLDATGRLDQETLLGLIDDELRGRPFQLESRAEDRARIDVAEDLRRTLDEAGVSPDQPDHAIKASLERHFREIDADDEARAIAEVQSGRYDPDYTRANRIPGFGDEAGEGAGAAGNAQTGQPAGRGSGGQQADGRAADAGDADTEPSAGRADTGGAGSGADASGRSEHGADGLKTSFETLDPDQVRHLQQIEAEIARLTPDELARLQVVDPSGVRLADGQPLRRTGAEVLDEIRAQENAAAEIAQCVLGNVTGAAT